MIKNMDINKTLKALREMHHLSQEEFGKIAGVSDKAVSAWETGTRIPRMGAIQKLADHFGLRKSDIIEGYLLDPHLRSRVCKGMELAEAVSDPDLQLLIRAKENLSSEDFRFVVNLVKRLTLKEKTR